MKSNIRCTACGCHRKPSHEKNCGTPKANSDKCVVYEKFDGKAYRAENKKIAKEKADAIAKELASIKAKMIADKEEAVRAKKEADDKLVAEAKAQEEKEAIEKAELAAKTKVEKLAKKQAEKEAREKAEAEAKQQAEVKDVIEPIAKGLTREELKDERPAEELQGTIPKANPEGAKEFFKGDKA